MLKNPRIAGLVAETILTGESERRSYELSAWVVMPNHVYIEENPVSALAGSAERWEGPARADRQNCLSHQILRRVDRKCRNSSGLRKRSTPDVPPSSGSTTILKV